MIDSKQQVVTNLTTKWRCPSNIAIVKYWGKKQTQIPCNASLSMTLSNAFTEVETILSPKVNPSSEIQLKYFFENKLNESFGSRVSKFLDENRASFPFLYGYSLEIHSFNSFPHSAGIASSASAFGALALSLLDLKYQLEDRDLDEEFYVQASDLARLASGSASRSLFPNYSLWGENKQVTDSSDNYAIEVNGVHPLFLTMKDAVLIVEDQPKKVSSSAGHGLMNEHPFAQQRFQQANERVVQLLDILKNGDFKKFIPLCESEALTLHAMMMTSKDYYLLMKPETITIIERIMAFREKNDVTMCFTLDAGPNIHLLYPSEVASVVEDFIKIELSGLYKDVIYDEIGKGPQKLHY